MAYGGGEMTERQCDYFNYLAEQLGLNSLRSRQLIKKLTNKKEFHDVTQKEMSDVLSYLEETKKGTIHASEARKKIINFITGKEVEEEVKEQKTTTNKDKGEDKMNTNKIFGAEFGKDKSGMFKVSPMGIAIKNSEGNYVCYDGTQIVDIMDMVFDIEGAIFKMPVTEIKAGDLLIINKEPVYVKSFQHLDNGSITSIKVINPITSKVEEIVPGSNAFGFNFKFFTKVTSLLDFNQGNQGGFNPMMLAFLDENEDNSINKLMAMQMMTQQQTPNNQENPMQQMLPFLLMKDGDAKGIANIMIMQQMMNKTNFNFGFNQEKKED